MLICGETSGDMLGAQLMAALKDLAGDAITITGVGGEAMQAQGLKQLFGLDATSVTGLQEVVAKIPEILRRVKIAADYAIATRPDAVVLIDSPDFTHRIAQRIKRLSPDLHTINYVAPQVWATRAYRARKMAKYFDLVLALLPFEPPFFAGYGLKAVFVGHPALERGAKMIGGEAFRARHNIPAEAPLLAVLPGSRNNEVKTLLPVFAETVRLLATRIPGLYTVLPTVPHVAARVREGTANWPAPLTLIEGEAEKFASFDAADAALAASGTVTTELALAKTPMVVSYKVGRLTAMIYRPLIRVKYYTLVNLILDRLAVPELMQEDCQPGLLADAVAPLLTDPAAAATQVADLEKALAAMGAGAESPSRRAAQAILDFLSENAAADCGKQPVDAAATQQ